MKRKWLVIGGVVLGVLVLLFILAVPAAPLWQRLGIEPICIAGSWPHLQVVTCQQPTAALPASPLPLPTPEGQWPIPVIVDDDGSPDGVIALLYLLRHPHFQVQAVTVSCGEAHPDLFARHLVQLLAGLGRSDIPVGVGRATPLEGNNAFPDPWRESSDAFWGLTLPPAPVPNEPVPAAELIVETLSRSTQPVLVFVSGNHTNLAEALRLQPDISERIRQVAIMGGAIRVPGNIESDWPSIKNSVAEWNIWVDPIAASEVFGSGRPLEVTPLDATNQVTWSRSDARAWSASGSPEGTLAAQMLESLLRMWATDRVFVWDLVAAVNATDPTLCPPVPLSLEVIVAPGPEQGRTLALDRTPNAAVCLKADEDQIRARAASILGR